METYVILGAATALAIFGVVAINTARAMMADSVRRLDEANAAYARATKLFYEVKDMADDRQLELELIGGKMNDR